MDSARLEYEMRKRNVSVRDMCAELGISRSAFYRKRSGKSEFVNQQGLYSPESQHFQGF